VDRELEAEYQEEAAAATRGVYRGLSLLVVAAWVALGWMDSVIAGTAANFRAAALVRYGVGLPLLLVAVAIGFGGERGFTRRRHAGLALMTLVLLTAGAIQALVVPDRSAFELGSGSLGFGVAIAILSPCAAILTQRLTVTAAGVLLAWAAAFAVSRAYPSPDNRPILLWYVVAAVGGLIAAYQVERTRRAAFLLRRESETLLHNVLPVRIVARLKDDPSSIAERFDAVTILFADVVGFTELTASLRPEELVTVLDDLFSAFDEIAQRHELEKIKTIGDAYMVAAGVPVPRADHAERVARMALEMRAIVARTEFLAWRKLGLRIGMHSGPVVAGVIGKKKFIYDVWGDTVNTASRMESQGVQGAIQVSEATRALLDGRFHLRERGPVQVKGKGEMRTWFLEGLAGATAGVAREGAPGASEEAGMSRGRYAQLGDALAVAGRGAEAARAYLAGVGAVGAARALDLRSRAAGQLLRSGHVDEAFAIFADVLREVRLRMPRSPRAALAGFLLRRLQLRLRGLAFEERSVERVRAAALARIDTAWTVGAGLGLVDTIVGQYFQTISLLLALDAGEPRRIARSLATEASFSSAGGGRTAARTAALLQKAGALAERLGSAYERAWAVGAAGIAATLEGRWVDAWPLCERAEAEFREDCPGASWELWTLRWFGLWSLAYLGRLDDLARLVPQGIREARDRSDLYAEIAHSTGLANMVWLAADDPAEARRRTRDVSKRWSRERFHVEHWWALLAECQVDLYEGDGAAAARRIGEQWPRLARSLLLNVQLTELEARHVRARAALCAVSAGGEPARWLPAAESDARRIAASGMPWSSPLADLVHAAAACVRGDRAGASTLLEGAESRLDAVGMALYASAARYRRGQLLGGDAGDRLVAEAREWLHARGAVQPARLVAMLAPGFPR
jgi:class 3 adenylate cyclase